MGDPVARMSPDEPSDASLAALGPLLDRLEVLLTDIEGLDDTVRDSFFELLDGVDAVHRLAVTRLADALSVDLRPLRCRDPAIDWLFQAYGVGVDDVDAASAALEQVRPYLHEHGGEVEVLSVQHGVVRVHLLGACSGCTAAAETLRHGVEEALRENLPGFVAMEVEPDDSAAPHPPPAQVLLQITPRPD
ncbi:MAG: NifU family protein [Nocardioidaceae bacterium]|nr:NifU family protein [Nocardioidaceae bacterium]MDQ3450381.1 NifU family protein [Actinomycetota bacterium]